jgi:peptidoglycan/LPS O-acetylase OafA/YrhL
MRSEHLSNVHPGWAALGWVIAVAVTAIVHLVLVGTGLLPPGGPEVFGGVAAVLLGFFAGGLVVGLRWSEAPILNGIAIALLSVVLWFVGALVAPEPIVEHLRFTGSAFTLGSVLLQLAAAVVGALAGRSLVLRGRVPDPAVLPPEA